MGHIFSLLMGHSHGLMGAGRGKAVSPLWTGSRQKGGAGRQTSPHTGQLLAHDPVSLGGPCSEHTGL